jgi:hypothetical protein
MTTPLNDPAYRTHPITFYAKHGKNSWADQIAECLIASRIDGHVLAPFSKTIDKVCFERIRRVDNWS